jgi:hypothetical protein
MGGVIDPACYAEDGGPSIAERLYKRGAIFRAADNKRVGTRGALGGWDQFRARLKGDGEKPMIYFFSSCIHTIRTIPLLPHDPMNFEDVDTDSEDHAADETRYACMARPMVKDRPGPKDHPRFLHETRAEEVFDLQGKFRRDPFKRERI